MIFKRKIYERLLQWKKKSAGKTALLIEGARRVGKSTIVEEFAKEQYGSYLIIDFSTASNAIKNIIDNYLDDLDVLYQLLSAETGVIFKRRDTLIVFDEVQCFPRAREAIRTLVNDGRYDFIETGSLISLRENVKNILIPSEEEAIMMYPLDFEEFCIACGEEALIAYVKDCFTKKVALSESLHHKAMLLVRQYMIVGGMPQSVSAYLENDKSFLYADEQKRLILKLYKDDIHKADNRYISKALQVFDNIPGFLSKKEKRIILSGMEGTPKYDAYADAFFWLQDSMIVNECFRCNDPNVGLSLNEDHTSVKCYLGDTGLLLSHTFNKKEISEGELYKKILNDRLSINQGMFFENLVAQMLRSQGYDLYFYTHYNPEKHRNDIEIDFLLSNGSKTNFKVEVIEVKSSKNYSTTSLDAFKKHFHKRVANSYIIHPKGFSIVEDKIYLPIYMGFLL